jgi:hypothetical protein
VPTSRAPQDVGELVVGVHERPAGVPARRRPRGGRSGPAANHVWHRVPAGSAKTPGEHPAVTLAMTKKPGENAVDVADARAIARVESLRAP